MDRYSRRRLLAWLLSTHELWAYYADPDVCVTIELKLPDLRRGVSLQMTPHPRGGLLVEVTFCPIWCVLFHLGWHVR